MMRSIVLMVVFACGEPGGRAVDPAPVQLPDFGPETGSTGTGLPEGEPSRSDIPRWPDLPADDGTSSTSGGGWSSSGTADLDASSTGPGQGHGSSSTGGSTGSGEPGSTGSGSSTGQEPSGCPCEPWIDNFCDLPPKTQGCAATFPGGYCDPDGDGAYFDADLNAGFLAWKAECA